MSSSMPRRLCAGMHQEVMMPECGDDDKDSATGTKWRSTPSPTRGHNWLAIDGGGAVSRALAH